jgi:hypothetical protein
VTTLPPIHPALRRLGYYVRASRRNSVARLLQRVDTRLVPINRARPADGHSYATCPACGTPGALWLQPDGQTMELTCRCIRGEFEVEELLGLLLTRGAT